jgi:hypothetical protein
MKQTATSDQYTAQLRETERFTKQKMFMHRVVFSTWFVRQNVTVSATLLGEGFFSESQCSFKEIHVTLHNSEEIYSYFDVVTLFLIAAILIPLNTIV